MHKTLFFLFVSLYSLSASCDDKGILIDPPKVTSNEALQNSYEKVKMKELYQEVLGSFTLYGKPIPPKVFQTMQPWVSDLMPSIISIDLNATAHSNQFYGDYFEDQKIIGFNKTYTAYGDDKDWYSYGVVGKLGHNKIIIISNDYEGGSRSSASLIVIEISLGKEKLSKKLSRYRLIAKQVFFTPLDLLGPFEFKDNILTINRSDLGKTWEKDFSFLLRGGEK